MLSLQALKNELRTTPSYRTYLTNKGINVTKYQNNTPEFNAIKSALEEFKNLPDMSTRGAARTVAPINYYKTVIKDALKTLKMKRKVANKGRSGVRYPWIVMNISNTNNIKEGIVTVKGLLYQNGWSLKWNKNANPNAFPVSKIFHGSTPNLYGNNKTAVVSQTVGKVCKTTTASQNNKLRTACQKGLAHTYSLSGNDYRVYKNGSAGLGVADLAKIVISIGKSGAQSKAKARASFLELKRNGDWGEIYTVLSINSQNILFKPGDVNASMAIINGDMNMLTYMWDTIESKQSFMYSGAVFWSGDRPALGLCLCEDAPYVRPLDGVFYYKNTPHNIQSLLTSVQSDKEYTSTPKTAPQKAHYVVGEILKKEQYWRLILAAVDTAHDFNYRTARASQAGITYQKCIMIRDVIKSIMPSQSTRDICDYIWDSIGSIENLFGKLSIIGTTQYSRSDPNQIQALYDELQSQNRGIVYDMGPYPPGPLGALVSITAGKYMDPAGG